MKCRAREYNAEYAKELSKVPARLRTISATPELPQGLVRPGGPGRAGGSSGPSPARS